MGTLRDEMTKVLNEWDKQDEQMNQPQQEIKMEEHTTATDKLIAFIEANPNITSVNIRKIFLGQNLNIPDGNLSSMLTQLTRRYILARKETDESQVGGKPVYAYTVIPEADRARLRTKAAEKLKAAQDRAARAREIKAAKQAAREQYDKLMQETEDKGDTRTGLRDLLPPSVATTSIYNTKPTTWSAQEALNGLSVLQARELYDELKKIFGG